MFASLWTPETWLSIVGTLLTAGVVGAEIKGAQTATEALQIVVREATEEAIQSATGLPIPINVKFASRSGGEILDGSSWDKIPITPNKLDEAYHYTAAKWGDAIKKEGLRPGSYATPTGDLSHLQAKIELALPPTRAAPEIKIRIDLEGLRKAGYEIPKSKRVSGTVKGPDGRVYQMPGGGHEIQFSYEIPSEFLEVLPIK